MLHHPSSAAVVRRELVGDLKRQAATHELLEDAAAVATELVGNAVRHAGPLPGGVLKVEWRTCPEGLQIRVVDGGSPQIPAMRRVGPESVDGRGLAIVASLASQWGVLPEDSGRCVWAWLGEVSQVAS